MSLNKDDFYLKNVELCKKLEPIMKKKGIREDAFIPYFIASTDIQTGKETLVTSDPLIIDGRYYREDHDSEFKVELYRPVAQRYFALKKLNKETGKCFDSLLLTWRKDSLEAALPEFKTKQRYSESLDLYLVYRTYNGKYIPYVDDLITSMLFSRGQESLEALAQLIILLDEESLL